jgi:hypothetical protein
MSLPLPLDAQPASDLSQSEAEQAVQEAFTNWTVAIEGMFLF